MRILYSESATGNVGDDLNTVLWPALFRSGFFSEKSDVGFLGVGSILSTHFACLPFEGKKVVFGAGARSVWSLPEFSGEWDIRFVRGPMTVKALGLPGTRWIADPAILLPEVIPAVGGAEKGRIGLVPYFRTPPSLLSQVADRCGLTIVSPHLPPEQFVSELARCERVFAEAMHGAILADAYRIPWCGVRLLSEAFEGFTARFKWQDTLRGLGLPDASVISVVPSAVRYARKGLNKPLMRTLNHPFVQRKLVDRIARVVERQVTNDGFRLSADGRLDEARGAIKEEIVALERDYS